MRPVLRLVVGLGGLFGLLFMIWEAQTGAFFRHTLLDRMAHPTSFWAIMMITTAALLAAIYWAMTAPKR